MKLDLASIQPTILLSNRARSRAEKLLQYYKQNNPQVAKRAYINILAVCAVEQFIQRLGFETDWVKSESHDFISHQLADVADLYIEGIGKLECRPVLPNEHSLLVPPETWCDRAGYLAVKLSPNLEQATILGFLPTVNAESIPLKNLGSITDLFKLLESAQPRSSQHPNQHQSANADLAAQDSPPVIYIQQWLQQQVSVGWEFVDTMMNRLMISEPGFSSLAASGYRNRTSLEQDQYLDITCQRKQVSLGQQAVWLTLNVASLSANQFRFELSVHPFEDSTYLPNGLVLKLFNEAGTSIMQAQALGATPFLAFSNFTGEVGESFSAELTWQDIHHRVFSDITAFLI